MSHRSDNAPHSTSAVDDISTPTTDELDLGVGTRTCAMVAPPQKLADDMVCLFIVFLDHAVPSATR